MSAEIHRLDNGVRVICDVMPHLETLAVCAVAGSGARLEAPAQNGWSHLLEHMVFKGAGGRSARELVETIESTGGQINAATGYERTSFQVRTLSAGLSPALEVLSDLIQHPELAGDDLEREKQVVAQEIAEAADAPDDLVFEMAQTAAFGDHPLGRPILGTVESLADVTPSLLEAWRRGLYAPENLVISLAGGFDQEAALTQVTQLFGRSATADAKTVLPGAFAGRVHEEVRKLEQAHLVVQMEGVAVGDPDYFAMRLLVEILGGGMSSRLFQEVRERLGLVYAVDAYVDAYADVGTVGIYAGCEAKKCGQTARTIGTEVARLKDGLRPGELSRAKAQIKAQSFMSREQPLNRAEQTAAQILIFGRTLEPSEISASVDLVSEADICGLAERLAASRSAVAVLGPKSARGAGDAFMDGLKG